MSSQPVDSCHLLRQVSARVSGRVATAESDSLASTCAAAGELVAWAVLSYPRTFFELEASRALKPARTTARTNMLHHVTGCHRRTQALNMRSSRRARQVCCDRPELWEQQRYDTSKQSPRQPSTDVCQQSRSHAANAAHAAHNPRPAMKRLCRAPD